MQPVEEIRMRVSGEFDILEVRREARDLAARIGFRGADLVLIATVASELARNILVHAHAGEVVVRPTQGAPGACIIARDSGPGMRDIPALLERAAHDDSSGLVGILRVVDKLEVSSEAGSGTVVVASKLLR